jgi:hypothetical protein
MFYVDSTCNADIWYSVIMKMYASFTQQKLAKFAQILGITNINFGLEVLKNKGTLCTG